MRPKQKKLSRRTRGKKLTATEEKMLKRSKKDIQLGRVVRLDLNLIEELD